MHDCLPPLKWGGLLVMNGDKLIDRLPDLLRRGKAGAPQRLSAQDTEPAFDLVQPGGIGRGVMKTYLRMSSQPAVLFRLVGIQIVEDHVNLTVRMQRHDFIHEIQELAPTPPRVVPRFYFSRQHVQGGKQRRRSVPGLVFNRFGGETPPHPRLF